MRLTFSLFILSLLCFSKAFPLHPEERELYSQISSRTSLTSTSDPENLPEASANPPIHPDKDAINQNLAKPPDQTNDPSLFDKGLAKPLALSDCTIDVSTDPQLVKIHLETTSWSQPVDDDDDDDDDDEKNIRFKSQFRAKIKNYGTVSKKDFKIKKNTSGGVVANIVMEKKTQYRDKKFPAEHQELEIRNKVYGWVGVMTS